MTLAQFLAEPIVDVPVADEIWREFWTSARYRDRPPRVGASAAVVFREVECLEPLEFWVVRRQDDERDTVRDFVETTVSALRQ